MRKSRYRLINIMQKAELRVRNLSTDEIELQANMESSSKRSSRNVTTEITASVIEEEMKAALSAMKVTDAPKTVFPIANAVGK